VVPTAVEADTPVSPSIKQMQPKPLKQFQSLISLLNMLEM
jgi:hypothetical protein